MSADNRTDAEVEASLKANLIMDGMPPELAGRAVDSWLTLVGNARALEMIIARSDGSPKSPGWWMQYCFMQGFVAGAAASRHYN